MAIRITATTTTIPMAIASHVLRLQPPRRSVPLLELSMSGLLGLVLRADAPLDGIRTEATDGSRRMGDERHPCRSGPDERCDEDAIQAESG